MHARLSMLEFKFRLSSVEHLKFEYGLAKITRFQLFYIHVQHFACLAAHVSDSGSLPGAQTILIAA